MRGYLYIKRYTLYLAVLGMLWVTGCSLSPKPEKKTTQETSDSLKAIIAFADSILYEDPTLALQKTYDGLSLAEEENNMYAKASLYGIIGTIFRAEGRYEKAIEFLEKGQSLALESKDTITYISILSEEGYAYLQMRDDAKALEDIATSVLTVKKLKSITPEQYYQHLLTAYIDLLQLYTSRREYSKAESYVDSCNLIISKSPDAKREARLYEAIGRLKLYQGFELGDVSLTQEAISNYRKSCDIYLALGEAGSAENNFFNISYAFENWAYMEYPDRDGPRPKTSQQLLDSAFFYIQEYLEISRERNRLQGIAAGLQTLASLNSKIGETKLAKGYLFESLRVAGEINSSKDSAYAYWMLSEIYETSGQSDSAIWYLKHYDGIAYNVRNQSSEEAMSFAEAQFETEKKELENAQIRALARQRFRNTLTIAIAIAIILIAIAGYFFTRNIQQKKLMSQQSTLNRQLVVDLIKEQAIESLNSRLEGQEKERKRVARELHDRLGGTLAAAKLSLEGLGRKIGHNFEEPYNHTKELLQLAYTETRQLSHDMMALPLKHLGLEASIKALCDTIDRSGKIKVTYDATFERASYLSAEAEIHLYRILQELLQNVIKHARANHVIVQISQTEETFILLVEDNGRGFPQGDGNTPKGMGLSNIQDRVDHLKGSLEIDSISGRGSTIIIQLPPNA